MTDKRTFHFIDTNNTINTFDLRNVRAKTHEKPFEQFGIIITQSLFSSMIQTDTETSLYTKNHKQILYSLMGYHTFNATQ